MPSGSGNGDMGADGEAGADCFHAAHGETEARSGLGGGLRQGNQHNSRLPKLSPWPSGSLQAVRGIGLLLAFGRAFPWLL